MPDKLLLYEGFRAWRVREGGLRRFFWKGKDLVLVMNHRVGYQTQLTFIYSKSSIETLEKDVKFVQS